MKICSNILFNIQNQFPGMSESHFVFVGYYTNDQICNPNRDCNLKY